MKFNFKNIQFRPSQSTSSRFGILSNEDIKREIAEKHLYIYPKPYIENSMTGDVQIKPASIDITPSCLIMSVRTGRFLKIYERKDIVNCKATENRYVFIEPRDTVLVISREYFIIPNNICGSVNSRVSTVSAGLGHISTTIDPGWKGALLIAVSNPSSVRKRLDIQKVNNKDCPLATVTFNYLCTPADIQLEKSKMPARVDILKKYMHTDNYWSVFHYIRKITSTIFHYNDFKLSNCIITELEKNISPENWTNTLDELEKIVLEEKIVVVKWKTGLLGFLKIGINLFISYLVFVIAFSIIYVISSMENNSSIFQIVLDIFKGDLPKNFNISIISLAISIVTFCKGIVNDSKKT